MGENPSTPYILSKKDESSTPKKVIFLKKLLKIDKPNGRINALTEKFFSSNKECYIKSSLANEIGNSKTDRLAHDFLETCIEQGLLVKEGEKGSPPNETEIYSINRTKIRKAFADDPYCQEQLPLFIDIINNEIDGQTVTSEIYLKDSGILRKIWTLLKKEYEIA